MFIWALFDPTTAGRIFIGIFIVGLQGYAVSGILIFNRSKFAPQFAALLTSEEFDLVNAYKFHFLYPGTTRELSSIVAALGLAAFAFVPPLLWKGAYIEAAIIGLNWFATGPLSHKLSPLNGLRGMAARGDSTSAQRLSAWDTAWTKVAAPKSGRYLGIEADPYWRARQPWYRCQRPVVPSFDLVAENQVCGRYPYLALKGARPSNHL